MCFGVSGTTTQLCCVSTSFFGKFRRLGLVFDVFAVLGKFLFRNKLSFPIPNRLPSILDCFGFSVESVFALISFLPFLVIFPFYFVFLAFQGIRLGLGFVSFKYGCRPNWPFSFWFIKIRVSLNLPISAFLVNQRAWSLIFRYSCANQRNISRLFFDLFLAGFSRQSFRYISLVSEPCSFGTTSSCRREDDQTRFR